jgi:hypothetical protein
MTKLCSYQENENKRNRVTQKIWQDFQDNNCYSIIG